MLEDNRHRTRGKRVYIRVTFPNGKTICYANVTDTMIATLNEIGVERFHEITLELCHRPLISKEIYPRYREYMKPICEGWYINAQSDTKTKFLQLRAINQSLGLNLTIELGEDFEKQENPGKIKRRQPKSKILVKFPDGDFVANENQTETFLEVVWKLGIDKIMRKDVLWGGNSIITLFQKSPSQIQIDSNRWIIVPNTTKDKAKLLKVISMHLGIKLEVNLI